MTNEHEAIEELLAGYVLRGLSGEDAMSADHLLSEHVPSCSACRDTLAVFQSVSADLALGTPPMEPPETLLPRLHRDLGAPPRRRRPMAVFAAAAGIVAVVGLAGLTVTQGLRASRFKQQATLAQSALDFSQRPGTSKVPVGPVSEFAHPGTREFYVYGKGVPDPAPGTVYRVWLASGSTFTVAGEFAPVDGLVVLRLTFDPSRFDRILICEEPRDGQGSTPGNDCWSSSTT